MIDYKYYDLIKWPIITEKSTMLAEERKYTFEVVKTAKKDSIKKAIEAIFNVKVKKVNVINVKGKIKRFKGITGHRSDRKKTIVTLVKDYSIDLTGGIK